MDGGRVGSLKRGCEGESTNEHTSVSLTHTMQQSAARDVGETGDFLVSFEPKTDFLSLSLR